MLTLCGQIYKEDRHYQWRIFVTRDTEISTIWGYNKINSAKSAMKRIAKKLGFELGQIDVIE